MGPLVDHLFKRYLFSPSATAGEFKRGCPNPESGAQALLGEKKKMERLTPGWILWGRVQYRPNDRLAVIARKFYFVVFAAFGGIVVTGVVGGFEVCMLILQDTDFIFEINSIWRNWSQNAQLN